MIGQGEDAVHEAGFQAAGGSFICLECSASISLDHSDSIPRCPSCGGEQFKRASLFEQPTHDHPVVEPDLEPEGWLDELRASAEPGKFAALHAGGRARLFELSEGWSRIGRSGAAEIRLDDPTVSRRHAVIVRTPEGKLRVLDDRSMNGIAVNGEQVDWSPLADGDKLSVGRYTLHILEI
jgi:DNA-directed RNA polymerase subunit RPC12/RpoP